MNFELKTLGLDRAALEKYDAMVLLVGEDFKPAQDAVWGGYSGYFADPDGFAWEVAWNPGFTLAEDGGLILPD